MILKSPYGQGMKYGPNRARRNVNFHGMGNYEDMDEDLDTIKLKISNFQGKNNPEAYWNGTKRYIGFFIAITILNKRGEIGDN